MPSHTAKGVGQFVVDTAQVVRSDGSIIGNREKVEAAHAAFQRANLDAAAIVDREFRGFQLDPPLMDLQPVHHVVNDTLFWTRGHSAENYCFTSDSVVYVLSVLFAEQLPIGYGDVIRAYFDAILIGTAAVSLAAQRVRVIDRLGDSLGRKHWIEGDNRNIQVSVDELCATLRRHETADEKVGEFGVALLGCLGDTSSLGREMNRWLSHGHIGTSLLWGAVAKVLSLSGVGLTTLDQIERGQKQEKLRIAGQKWVQDCLAGRDDCPVQLCEWLARSKPLAAPDAPCGPG